MAVLRRYNGSMRSLRPKRTSRVSHFAKFAWLLLPLALAGCQTPTWKNFDRVRQGQYKDNVIEEIGNPSATRRVHGQDWWIYNFWNHPDGEMPREVHFENGRVVYAGPPQRQKMAPEEQDKINASAVQQESDWMDAEEARRDQRLGASRPARVTPAQYAEDPADRKMRESLYGIERDRQLEKRKQAPVFVPVE